MNKKIFLFPILLLLFSLNAMATPTLASVDIAPNPAWSGETLTITAEGKDFDTNKDAFNDNAPAGQSMNQLAWNCQSFKTTTGGTFYEAWYGSHETAGDDLNRGRILEYVDYTHVGDLLSEGTGAITRDLIAGATYWHTFSWDTNFSMGADTNYWFCFENSKEVGGSTSLQLSPTDVYSHGRKLGGLPGHNDINTSTDLSQFNDSDEDHGFRIYTQDTNDVKLQTIISYETIAGTQNYDTNNVAESGFVSSDPTDTFSNPLAKTGDFSTTLVNADATRSNDVNFSLTVLTPLTDFLTCTGLSNVASCTVDFNIVEVTPSNNDADVHFRLDSSSAGVEHVPISVLNGDDSGKQYKVYTATPTNYANGTWNFSDSLTFGSTGYDAIQKIWNTGKDKYFYTINDKFLPVETINYRFEYYAPTYHWNSIAADPDWIHALAPASSDFNGTPIDLFSTSVYSNVDSFLSDPEFPAITAGGDAVNYILQLTGKASATGTGQLQMGTQSDLVGGGESLTNYDLNTFWKTLSLTTIGNGYVGIETDSLTAKTVYLHNYVVVERGHFTKFLEVFDWDGSELPVILSGSNAYQYVREGANFIVDTEYINTDNNIDRVEVVAYLGTVADANAIKTWAFEAETSDDPIHFRETVGGIIDLSTEGNKDLKLVVKLYDADTNTYQIQSDLFKLVQFPYFGGDFTINATISGNKVGNSPFGRIIIRDIAPETLEGVNFYIYQATTGSTTSSDYNTAYYKGVDFSCMGFDCSFDYEIEDWVFETSGTHKLTVSALLTTQLEDVDSILTARTLTFGVPYQTFETARILETFERNADHNYRNDEEIPLVMQVRNDDYANLKNDLITYITPENCDSRTGGNCISLDVNYSPDSFLYDATTGYNYWFFKELFVQSDGTALDQNYLRIQGFVTDQTNKHQTDATPLLTAKCATYPAGDCNSLFCYIPNALASLNHFLGGCQTPNPPVVTLDTNTASENRIGIEPTRTRTLSTQECLACVNADTNNVYVDQLKQDLTCVSWYKTGETPLDRYDFYVTNQYSDLSKEGDVAQYIKISVPYEIIAFNDMWIMQQAMQLDFGTYPDTVGEVIFYGMNELITPILNPLSDILEGTTASGLLTNVGYECDFDKAIDPTTVSGFIWFKVKGISVINKKDLEQHDSELVPVDPVDLREYARYIEDELDIDTTKIEVYVSDFTKVLEKQVESPLVVDEEYSLASLKQENLDENKGSAYATLPTRLKFNIIGDLFYNNESAVIRRYVPIFITTVITQGSTDWLAWVVLFLVSNWFGILVLMVFILFIAVVTNKLKLSSRRSIYD